MDDDPADPPCRLIRNNPTAQKKLQGMQPWEHEKSEQFAKVKCARMISSK